jgi:hypothetical protein
MKSKPQLQVSGAMKVWQTCTHGLWAKDERPDVKTLKEMSFQLTSDPQDK